MKRVNILQVIGGMNTGGAETFLMNVFRNINRDKYHFYFLCYGNQKYDYEDEIRKLGGTVIRIDKPKNRFDISSIQKIAKIINKYKITVVHTHTYYNSMYSILAAKKAHIAKIFCHSHNTESEPNISLSKKIYAQLSKAIIRNLSTGLIACGQDAGKALFGNRSFIIMNNGIDLKKYAFNSKQRKIEREKYDIKDEDILIGHIGRFEEVKNHKFLIEIMAKLVERNPHYKLLLFGGGSKEDEIKKKIRDNNLQNSVIVAGKRLDIHNAYNAFDLMVYPSLFEGFPVTFVEAQANGLKIIASDTIDKTTNITGNISFLPLEEQNKWLDGIINLDKTRKDNTKLLEKSAYNIRNTVKQLEELYK